MAIPTVVGVGAVASGTGSITPAYPGGYTAIADDVAITYVETESETITPPANWAVLNTSAVGSGTVTRLTALWRRLTAAEAAPSITTTANHKVGRMIVIRGCIATGNPWHIAVPDIELTSDTSVSVTGGVTSAPDTLVLSAFSMGNDIANTTALTWTNASLANIAHRMANWVIDGLGGGFAMCTGEKAAPGSISATTTTSSVAANFKALMMIALLPAAPGVVPSWSQRSPRPSESAQLSGGPYSSPSAPSSIVQGG